MNRQDEAFQNAGMSAAEARAKSLIFDRLQQTATDLGICAAQHAFFVP